MGSVGRRASDAGLRGLTRILLDTHAWAWSLSASERLSPGARAAISEADIRYVSPISLYEVGQKTRLRRWPEMQPLVPRLVEIASEQGNAIARLDADICLAAATLDWPHRDPIDRIIAATCLAESLALVSADAAFDGLGRLARVW